ncbi:MAG: transcriptional activator NhaR [Isosphaeraceae bacterium]|nr:MAG: transcriptional activator NhaR [Isosphaeraceae bacterium]
MDWLNYHHLLYFWTVAREGSITKACERLHLAQPTISAQIRSLEKSLGEPLFERQGRRLVLTEVGRLVYRYADEIFTLGRELRDTIKGRPSGGRPLRLRVGVADALPKQVVYRLLEPALRLDQSLQIICYEGKPEPLVAELALHALDIVLSDTPLGPGAKVRAFSHQLGECGITIMGTPKLIAQLSGPFPDCLHDAPMLLPTDNTTLRHSLEPWFDSLGIRPRVVAEFEDTALLKVFGQAGLGLFVIPSVIETEVCRQYGVEVVGRTEALRERFYAISIERKLKHPAVVAISEAARRELFA